MIQRLHGTHPGRNPAVVHNGLVYAVATDTSGGTTIKEQTRQTLATLDDLLAQTGSARSAILQATVYLADMSNKPAMDAVWCDWIGPDPDTWPQRACVGADLAGSDMIEIVITAAQIHPDT